MRTALKNGLYALLFAYLVVGFTKAIFFTSTDTYYSNRCSAQQMTCK
jgi:hypothetical protein